MEADKRDKTKRAFLFIERGEPYSARTRFGLGESPTSVGRASIDASPDIAFENTHISRKHLMIEFRDGAYFAIDPGSKNGTCLNDSALERGLSAEIHSGDRLRLANDAAILLFATEEDLGTESMSQKAEEANVDLDDARREIAVDGKAIRLSGNLYSLFRALYLNRGRAVSNSEIREAVWPERARDESGVPNAADLEINTLVMRLRKRLGESGGLICNLRGYGYMLDID
jgi:pSer/pThr/pTyr-binding forkhead associated (FHA) protein